MLQAVLFDMDGVIVDTEPLHRKAYFKMFEEMDIAVSEEHYASFTGQSTQNICNHLVKEFQMSEQPQALVTCKRRYFTHLFQNDDTLQLIDGVLECIKDYHSNGLKLVVASSASMDNINSIFERFNLNQYFLAKLSGADLKKSKPHPEIFMKAAAAAEEPVENCIVIEDSTNGIAAAKAANIFCIGYNSLHSKDQDYSRADKVVDDFRKITFNEIKNWV